MIQSSLVDERGVRDFLVELVNDSGLEFQFSASSGSTAPSGILVCDGMSLEITFFNQLRARFVTEWHLAFPGREVWTGPLMWTSLPAAGWDKPGSPTRNASLSRGREILKRLPRGLRELMTEAESALVGRGMSVFDLGDAVVLYLGSRALLGLDVGQSWLNALIRAIARHGGSEMAQEWTIHPRVSLPMAIAAELYLVQAQLQVAMDWEPAESRAQAVRTPSIKAILRQLGSHPPTVSIQLGPRARWTATVTDNEVRFDLAQTLFPWEVLPFPAVSVVTVPRPKGGAADVAAQVREWMTPRGFLELTRGVLGVCQEMQDEELTVWNWSVFCTAIEASRRGTLTFRQQDQLLRRLEPDEETLWPAVRTAVLSVAAACRERGKAA